MTATWDIFPLPDPDLWDRRQKFPVNNGCPERASAILRRLPPDASCYAEVGVYLGDLAELVIRRRPGMRMVLVDSWSEAQIKTEDAHSNSTQEEHDDAFEFCKARMAFAGDAVLIMPWPSLDAARMLENESLDMVFIDANHGYEAVRSDIAAWLPKVKQGGWISGHDYENPSFPRFGVKRAVDELFGSKVELDIDFTWFVKKDWT